jgi:cell wall-associated NlpC family hydrolase
MTAFDRRLTPARPDLAAAHLAGKVTADRFVEGRAMRVDLPVAPLRRSPAPDAPLDTEALMGEAVTVYESDEEGWAWGQLAADGYVGWLPAEALRPADAFPAPTHRVAPLRSFVYPGPSIKLPPSAALSIGSSASVVRSEGDFAVLATGGFVFARHLVPLGESEPDFVAVAECFVGVPYLWGGKTSLGLDCSGLVQVSLAAAGLSAPRDSDMQEAGLGSALPGEADLARGDLVFWKGHVGILVDPVTLLHASGHHMLVVREPLAAARARIASATGADWTGLRRLAAGS